MDAFPDLDSLTDQGLKDLIVELNAEEEHVSTAEGERNERTLDTPGPNLSYRRRVLRGKLGVVRGELVNRRRRRENEGGEDPGAGSSGVREPRRPTPQPGAGEISLPVDEDAGDDSCEPTTPQQRPQV